MMRIKIFSLSTTNYLFVFISILLVVVCEKNLAYSFSSTTSRRIRSAVNSSSNNNNDNNNNVISRSVIHGSFTSTNHKHKLSMAYNSRSNNNSVLIKMHMGHSHSHHDHIHHDHETSASNNNNNSNVPYILSERRRLAAMFIFSGLAVLGPKLIRGKTIAKNDISVFLVTMIGLFAFQPIKGQITYYIHKVRNMIKGIAKHSTPISVNYFFKNDSPADRVTLLGGVINIFLSIAKFIVGVYCNSSALIADAGHSLSDLFSDVITLWSTAVSRLPADEDHPYGHGKFEAIGSLFLSLTLFGTGIGIGAVSNRKLLEILTLQRQAGGLQQLTNVAIPGVAALVMAGLSVVSKEWLYRITKAVGERLNSQVVIANAWHHRSDAYSSILALASIAIARTIPGLVFVDAAAGIFVAGMICMTGAEILGESIKQLTDTSNETLTQQIKGIVQENKDVAEVVRVRTRQVGSASAVDLAVVPTVAKTPAATRAVEEQLKKEILKKTDGNVLEVDVRATTPMINNNNSNDIICPLLQARRVISEAEVESCVRDEIMTRNPIEIESVERVHVNYLDHNQHHDNINDTTFIVNVDVHIRMKNNVVQSIVHANQIANRIRTTLERSKQINNANIYLDLNVNAAKQEKQKEEIVKP